MEVVDDGGRKRALGGEVGADPGPRPLVAGGRRERCVRLCPPMT